MPLVLQQRLLGLLASFPRGSNRRPIYTTIRGRRHSRGRCRQPTCARRNRIDCSHRGRQAIPIARSLGPKCQRCRPSCYCVLEMMRQNGRLERERILLLLLRSQLFRIRKLRKGKRRFSSSPRLYPGAGPGFGGKGRVDAALGLGEAALTVDLVDADAERL